MLSQDQPVQALLVFAECLETRDLHTGMCSTSLLNAASYFEYVDLTKRILGPCICVYA